MVIGIFNQQSLLFSFPFFFLMMMMMMMMMKVKRMKIMKAGTIEIIKKGPFLLFSFHFAPF